MGTWPAIAMGKHMPSCAEVQVGLACVATTGFTAKHKKIGEAMDMHTVFQSSLFCVCIKGCMHRQSTNV